MLRAIYSSLLASPVTSRTNSQAKHGCTWYSKEGSPPAFRVMFCTSERNKPCPLSSLSFSSQATEDLSMSRPGCRKRKCRVWMCFALRLARSCQIAFCLAQRCEVRRSLFRRDVSSRSASAPRKRLASVAICGHLARSESCYRILVSLVCHD
jgi:hypothetical protein